MKPPCDGMTKRPWGEDFMAPAFMGLLAFAAGQADIVEAFAKEHPKLRILPARSAIEAAIDKAAGIDRTVGAAFADWVAETMWGLEEEGEPTATEL